MLVQLLHYEHAYKVFVTIYFFVFAYAEKHISCARKTIYCDGEIS